MRAAMNLAGHVDFKTTLKFYPAVREDLLQLARLTTVTASEYELWHRYGTHSFWGQKRFDSLCSKLLYCNGLNSEAPVAQLDRASVYGTETGFCKYLWLND